MFVFLQQFDLLIVLIFIFILQGAKTTEERTQQVKEDIDKSKRQLADLNSSTTEVADNGDAAKYELLQKRDQDMTAFMDKFDEVNSFFICVGVCWCWCLNVNIQ